MDIAAYEAESVLEADHWWFVGRRKLFLREMARLDIPRAAAILDIGTSTGTNLRMLRDAGFTNVRGLDFSPVAAKFCAEKGFGTVEVGDVCALPFADESFDFILATDIIEHVDDDSLAIKEIRRVLKPSALVLFTVPTFPELWGHQDEIVHHKRRYYKRTFQSLVVRAGLDVVRTYYFNYILFSPIWAVRKLVKFLPQKPESELKMNNSMLNAILTLIFRLDVSTADILRPPAGVSALCIARKPVTG